MFLLHIRIFRYKLMIITRHYLSNKMTVIIIYFLICTSNVSRKDQITRKLVYMGQKAKRVQCVHINHTYIPLFVVLPVTNK